MIAALVHFPSVFFEGAIRTLSSKRANAEWIARRTSLTPCTRRVPHFGEFACFHSFCRLVESVSCVESVGRIPTSPSTISDKDMVSRAKFPRFLRERSRGAPGFSRARRKYPSEVPANFAHYSCPEGTNSKGRKCLLLHPTLLRQLLLRKASPTIPQTHPTTTKARVQLGRPRARPVKRIWTEEHPTLFSARLCENQLKRCSHAKKAALIDRTFQLRSWLTRGKLDRPHQSFFCCACVAHQQQHQHHPHERNKTGYDDNLVKGVPRQRFGRIGKISN
jgi:hypothetical protein